MPPETKLGGGGKKLPPSGQKPVSFEDPRPKLTLLKNWDELPVMERVKIRLQTFVARIKSYL